jgi:UDP-sugar transporter A1/2/3
MQMAFGGCIVGFAGCYVRDGASIREVGFFQGYTPFTVFIVVFSASGGLIIAVVMKYADNIYKVGYDHIVLGRRSTFLPRKSTLF